jgi:hypothetical protein
LRGQDLNLRPSGYEPMDPEFDLSLQFSGLACKPLKSQYRLVVARWQFTDFEGLPRIGMAQNCICGLRWR